MKKLLLLPLLILMFSCSSEEEGPIDPIVGTWKYMRLIEHPQNGDDVLIKEATECQLLRTMTFSKNGNLTTTEYHWINEDGCVLNPVSSDDDLIWEKIGEGHYRISSVRYPTGSEYRISFFGSSEMRFISEKVYTKYTAQGEIIIGKNEEIYLRN